MIIVENVHKRYHTEHGPGKWVLKGVTLTIPTKVNVGLIGRNGAGKSTLLNLISDTDQPDRGRIERRCRVSWPLGHGRGMQGILTGRQNAKFVCRVHGHESDMADRLQAIQDFAELGEAFDEPTNTYSSGMKSRLQFALSLAFDFDIYIADEIISAGDSVFQKKTRVAFKERADHAGLIWLRDGEAVWFDNIDDALKAYTDSLPK
jgi:capsular polysaccharide transport system ATP-binding protein